MACAVTVKFTLLLAALTFVAGKQQHCQNAFRKNDDYRNLGYQTKQASTIKAPFDISSSNQIACGNKMRYKRQDGGIFQFGFLDIMAKPEPDTAYMISFLKDIKERYRKWKQGVTPLPRE